MSSAPASPHKTPFRSRVAERLASWLGRLLDVRAGERSLVILAFSVLLLAISAHTMLETARDTLLLVRMPRRALGVVYVIIAVLTLPTGAIAAMLGQTMGARRSLIYSLGVAAVLVVAVSALPAGPGAAMTLYVLTGLIGAVLVPQFWAFMGGLFTVAEGRRLLGPIASAGVFGGVVGSTIAALAVRVMPTRYLLFVAAVLFLGAAAALFFSKRQRAETDTTAKVGPSKKMLSRDAMQELVADPFVARIGGLVALSTAAVLALDYLFKWSVAETVPARDIGRFLATYYAFLNGVSLVMQLFVGGILVRRLGVTTAAMVTPLLLTASAFAMVVTGGSPATILAAKGTDGALRHSVHRITTELVYLPIPGETRARVKPFIDGALARFAQALTACLLLAATELGQLTRGRMVGLVVVLCVAWLALAANTRGPYLAVFRKALSGDQSADAGQGNALDFATAEMLLEHLASPKPEAVVAAARVLERRGRQRVIPALLLYHPSPAVLTHALALFGASDRTDFLPIAEQLVAHPDESVRMAALRALSRRGRVDLLERLAEKEAPRIRAYVTVWIEIRASFAEQRRFDIARLVALLEAVVVLPSTAAEIARGVQGHETGKADTADLGGVREGILAAIADAPPLPELSDLVLRLWEDPARPDSPDLIVENERADLLARAAAAQPDPRLAELLVDRLATRIGREEMRAALVRGGDPAFHAVLARLRDETAPRHLRAHMPRTLSRFGTARAAEALLSCIESEKDGLVRYKAIRGLGRIVAENRLKVDRARVEALASLNLVEYLRLLGLSASLAKGSLETTGGDRRRALATRRFLAGLLADKMRQSLERSFRLMKIAHPLEDIHSVHRAALSNDKAARANAGEFLDTLLTRRHERELRSLLRLVTDDLDPEDRVARSTALLRSTPPSTYEEAVVALAADADAFVSRIACEHAHATGNKTLDAAAREASKTFERPSGGASKVALDLGASAHGV